MANQHFIDDPPPLGGDEDEREAWAKFASKEFPRYQTFWSGFTWPLTQRPKNILFRSATDLHALGFGDEHVCIAQLSYSVLKHLLGAHRQRSGVDQSRDMFVHCIMRLAAATDVADELLQRYSVLGSGGYDPWSETAGQLARSKWRKKHQELRTVRNYRNHLVHGRVSMGVQDVNTHVNYFPKIGRETAYLDWRRVTSATSGLGADFASASSITADAWRQVLDYLDIQWRDVLHA